MDFCTTVLNDDNLFEVSWCRMWYNSDFINLLKTKGRLPETSVNRQLELMDEYDSLKIYSQKQEAKLEQIES